LYRLIPVFVFGLSYIVLGETLQPKQIVGGCFTITGAILLVVDLGKRGHGFDLVTFCLMGAACLMNACTVVIFKSIALETSFWCSAFWEYVGAAIFSLTLIGMVPSHRRALRALFGSRDAYVLVPLTLSGEAFNLLANLAVGFAGLMAPLALVSIVTGLHPFFLLGYGIVLTLFFPTFGRERLARRQILRKVVAIGVMCAGMATTFIA
jgi:drug/metabolite transporter (DMT)-like permease